MKRSPTVRNVKLNRFLLEHVEYLLSQTLHLHLCYIYVVARFTVYDIIRKLWVIFQVIFKLIRMRGWAGGNTVKTGTKRDFYKTI